MLLNAKGRKLADFYCGYLRRWQIKVDFCTDGDMVFLAMQSSVVGIV